MFSKASKTREATATTAAPRKPVPASLISEDLRLTGDIATTGDLHLDGQIEGNLQVSVLTVGTWKLGS